MRKLPSFIATLLILAVIFAFHWSFYSVEGSLEYSNQQFLNWDFLESKNAYFYILLITIAFPLLYSFDKKVGYYKKWKYLWSPYLFISLPFILWDVYFTQWGVWGFNEKYISGIHIGNLPLEEVLFFIVIPFSCIFIYECVREYGVTKYLHRIGSLFIGLILLGAVFFVSINFSALYTFSAGFMTIVVIAFAELTLDRQIKREIYLALFFSFIPFFLINSLLTGSATEEPIVVYNMAENLSLRLGSIPLDDVFYQTAMLGSMLLVYQMAKKI